jgi:hypothetical protein
MFKLSIEYIPVYKTVSQLPLYPYYYEVCFIMLKASNLGEFEMIKAY